MYMIDMLLKNPEVVLVVIMAVWSFVESMGWGFLSDEQRKKAKDMVRKLFGG